MSYPTYEMGATLAGFRAVAYRRLADIDEADAARALALWVNSPGNPTGELVDLAAAAAWGRARGVPVLSDECYAEFTWAAGPTTILRAGVAGVLAVHSLSKRDNFAGARIGFYAGDPDLVHYLREVRKHAGLMPAGPVQQAAIVALDDDAHVDRQRERYARRLGRLQEILSASGTRRPDRTAPSTCGCRCPAETPGRLLSISPARPASSYHRASSTGRPASTTSGSRPCNRTSSSTLRRAASGPDRGPVRSVVRR